MPPPLAAVAGEKELRAAWVTEAAAAGRAPRRVGGGGWRGGGCRGLLARIMICKTNCKT